MVDPEKNGEKETLHFRMVVLWDIEEAQMGVQWRHSECRRRLAVYSRCALNSGDLAPNGKKEADLYFQVPKDDAELTLHYESSIWSDKTINIKL